jgi:hypothetical protein
MNKKVTDLEKFALEQIVRPYQTMIVADDRHLFVLPYTLDQLLEMLRDKHGDWSDLVLDRIYRCGFWFPPYIQSDLVTFIEIYITERMKKEKVSKR